MSGINSSNGPKAKPQAKLGATSSAAAFGGANANILAEVFATNLAGIGALNDATKSQEDLLTYYNAKAKKLSDAMTVLNKYISKGKRVKLSANPKLEAAQAVVYQMTGYESGDSDYKVEYMKKGLSAAQNKLQEINTTSQAVGQRASNLTNAINTLTQQMSALTTAEASAISFPQ